MIRFAALLPFTLTLFVLTGCLTVAEKEYHIRLTGNGSGRAVIRFLDIGSSTDDTTDVSQEDFEHLVSSYLEGTQFEEQNPGWHNIEKRLYEGDGLLHGEISFDFDSLGSVWLYQFEGCGPLMYYIGTDRFAEEVRATNGSFRPQVMPVVFWPEGTTEFHLRTRIRSEAPGRISLAPLFRQWKKSRPEPAQEK